MTRKIWGVDSAVKVSDTLYSCVTTNFGTPKYWGRYLTDVPNVSEGLTKEEINFIRFKETKILPIYNVFTAAVSYDQGQIAARNAVFHARRLNIPTDIAIFANVANFLEVDSAWIRGWVESLILTGYQPGIYADPVKGNFNTSYCEIVAKDNKIRDQVILWSRQPEPGVTKEKMTPRYRPSTPNCQGNVWIWQYGRDSEKCSIDTNLADERVLKYLY